MMGEKKDETDEGVGWCATLTYCVSIKDVSNVVQVTEWKQRVVSYLALRLGIRILV